MTKYILLTLVLVLGNVGTLRARDYLLRVELVADSKPPTKAGTIEFHAVEGRPFWVRSTFGGDAQFLIRGTLEKVDDAKFDLEYSCQVSELRTDPLPRLTREGKARLTVVAKDEFISKLETVNNEDSSPLDFKISVRYLEPLFGTRDSHSGWAVRLVDADGAPVAGAHGGLYGPGSKFEANVESTSDKDGIIRISELRAFLSVMTFYAEHKERKLYAAAHLNLDDIRSEDYKYYTIKMTESLKRWSKPKE